MPLLSLISLAPCKGICARGRRSGVGLHILQGGGPRASASWVSPPRSWLWRTTRACRPSRCSGGEGRALRGSRCARLVVGGRCVAVWRGRGLPLGCLVCRVGSGVTTLLAPGREPFGTLTPLSMRAWPRRGGIVRARSSPPMPLVGCLGSSMSVGPVCWSWLWGPPLVVEALVPALEGLALKMLFALSGHLRHNVTTHRCRLCLLLLVRRRRRRSLLCRSSRRSCVGIGIRAGQCLVDLLRFRAGFPGRFRSAAARSDLYNFGSAARFLALCALL